MSRIGKQIITLPPKTEVTKGDGVLIVKGPKGEVSKKFREDIEIKIDGSTIVLTPKHLTLDTKALWGTYAAHVKNMVHGVHTPYEKKLIVEGVGFRAELKGKELVFALGFSHPVRVSVPDKITVTAEKNLITISGVDKEEVGSFAAKVRALKKPEPYKGKGIRYEGEVLRRKQGKKAV